MKLTDEQKTELREAALGVMPEMVDLDNGQWWWECGCNDDGHLNSDGRMCSLTGAWSHVIDDHLAPVIESWTEDECSQAMSDVMGARPAYVCGSSVKP